jgi:hypothetical protein
MGKLKPSGYLPENDPAMQRGVQGNKQTVIRWIPSKTERMQKEHEMEKAELTIQRGLTNDAIYNLARDSWQDRNPNATFFWSNHVARNAIRHCLTNYESQWFKINPLGPPGIGAYNILRTRVDRLCDEAYPQFAENMPEVGIGKGWEHKCNKKQPSPAPPPAPLNTSMATALSAAMKLKKVGGDNA